MSFKVKVTGGTAVIAALRLLEPELHKVMADEIEAALAPVARGAASRYPRGSWVVRGDKKRLLGVVTTAGGSVSKAGWGKSPPGVRAAIFEFIGSSYGGTRPQVTRAIASLNARYGSPGRFLWSAWDQEGGRVIARVEQAVEQAARELQRRLDQAGG